MGGGLCLFTTRSFGANCLFVVDFDIDIVFARFGLGMGHRILLRLAFLLTRYYYVLFRFGFAPFLLRISHILNDHSIPQRKNPFFPQRPLIFVAGTYCGTIESTFEYPLRFAL